MHKTHTGDSGGLYRFVSGKPAMYAKEQTHSNGFAFRKHDGDSFVLHVDSTRKILTERKLDRETGKPGEPVVLIDFKEDRAMPYQIYGPVNGPNGDSLLVAMYNAVKSSSPHGEVRQYHLNSGVVEATYMTPYSSRVTSPTLIALEGKVYLIAATAAENMPVRSMNAGFIFKAETDFKPEDLPPVLKFKL